MRRVIDNLAFLNFLQFVDFTVILFLWTEGQKYGDPKRKTDLQYISLIALILFAIDLVIIKAFSNKSKSSNVINWPDIINRFFFNFDLCLYSVYMRLKKYCLPFNITELLLCFPWELNKLYFNLIKFLRIVYFFFY